MTIQLSFEENFSDIVDRVNNGDVFVYPTDTVYGLGAHINYPESIRRIFSIKDRDRAKTVPILMNKNSVENYVTLSKQEATAIHAFWPGKVTFVLRVTDPNVWPRTLLRNKTVAVRAPGLPPLLELLNETGPITGTSANPAGVDASRSLDNIAHNFLETVDFVVEGPTGDGLSSTVAEWDFRSDEWIIHREGPVTKPQLESEASNSLS